MTSDPITLLFGGMAKLGPGDDGHSRLVLRRLPARPWRVVVDAGCGSGRQTLLLARELGALIHAVDTHAPFLGDLARRAAEAKLDHLVRPHLMDMKDIPQAFAEIDLLWSEGAAYSIGFAEALAAWAPALAAGGYVVVSELSWLKEDAPGDVREFFRTGYPAMRSVADNVAAARAAGYALRGIHVLPREAWVEGYYDVLGPKAQALLDHPDPAVRELAADVVREIEVFAQADDSYGYVFYTLQRG